MKVLLIILAILQLLAGGIAIAEVDDLPVSLGSMLWHIGIGLVLAYVAFCWGPK